MSEFVAKQIGLVITTFMAKEVNVHQKIWFRPLVLYNFKSFGVSPFVCCDFCVLKHLKHEIFSSLRSTTSLTNRSGSSPTSSGERSPTWRRPSGWPARTRATSPTSPRWRRSRSRSSSTSRWWPGRWSSSERLIPSSGPECMPILRWTTEFCVYISIFSNQNMQLFNNNNN